MQGSVRSESDLLGVPFAGVIQVDEDGQQRIDRTSATTDDIGKFYLPDAAHGDRLLITHVNFDDHYHIIESDDMIIDITPTIYGIGTAVVVGDRQKKWYQTTLAKVGFALGLIGLIYYFTTRK